MDTAIPRYFLRINLCARVALSNQEFFPGLMTVLFVLALAFPVCAQDFVPEQVVFPITDFKPDIKHLAVVSIKFGTGFCLDHECRFVGTNYHVAKLMGKYVRIKGVLSAHRYLDSDPNDVGAQVVNLDGGGSLRYTPAHDLAIYEMRRPLKHFHGVSFEAEDLENGPEVDIYAYPLNRNPKRGLVHWHGRFIGETPSGLNAFSYEGGGFRGGASGGIVVDRKTKKIVGILNCSGVPYGIYEGKNKDHIVLAVPIRELSDFVARAQPYLQVALFPKTVFVSPVAADLYRPYVWSRAESVSHRSAEQVEVAKLRFTAQHLAESMLNFTATQTFAWGHDNGEPEATDAYETLIADGEQRWRRLGGKKLYSEVPFPLLNMWILPGSEWSMLPQIVGLNFELKIHQAPDAVMGGRTVHVFQYSGNAEDRVCSFTYVTSYVFFQRGTTHFYDCHGEIWTTESGTILRISRSMDLTGPAYHFWEVMTYGWLEKDGRRYLVPVTITTQVEQSRTNWCRGLFTDYEMFGVKSRLVLTTNPR